MWRKEALSLFSKALPRIAGFSTVMTAMIVWTCTTFHGTGFAGVVVEFGDGRIEVVNINTSVTNADLTRPGSRDLVIKFNMITGSVYSPSIIIPLTRSNKNNMDELVPIIISAGIGNGEFYVDEAEGAECIAVKSTFYTYISPNSYKSYYVRYFRDEPYGDSNINIDIYSIEPLAQSLSTPNWITQYTLRKSSSYSEVSQLCYAEEIQETEVNLLRDIIEKEK